VGLGAALEIFLGHLPLLPGQAKHIIVAAHSDCAGLKTCHRRDYRPQDRCLPHYLENLRGAHEAVLRQAEGQGLSDEQLLHALEEASVRQSIANLKEYPVVGEALVRGQLKLHGWVNDTASGLIRELNPATGHFQPMSEVAA
jgi:carbonic anhydrase